MKMLIEKIRSMSVADINDLAKSTHSGIKKVLYYLRINDEQSRVSLTNIALMLMIYKIAITNATSMTDLTALAIAILGYQCKKLICKN
jgi:hypothetical protein